MPYPSKTDRSTILLKAIAEIEKNGAQDLSLRGLAAELGLATNALYKYFADKAALRAAIAEKCAADVEAAMKTASEGFEPEQAIRRMAIAYIDFAQKNPNIYQVMTSYHDHSHDETARHNLFAFTCSKLALVCGSERAAESSIAFWAMLHGSVSLQAAGVFGELKPVSGLNFGFEALMKSLKSPPDSVAVTFQD